MSLDLFERASVLHAKATVSFQSSNTVTSTQSEHAFLQKILQSGTLSDRLSALTLLVQSSPLHNTKSLDALKSLAERGKGKGGRGDSLKALRCIVDWWVGGGAPDRKLKYFRDQPLTKTVDDDQLLAWYFEDWLKKYFFAVLQILERLSADPLPYVRTQTLSLICNLLQNKPEQEHNLLRLLVNKLGDGEKQICSRASYHILQVLQAHPLMKTVVIREVTSLILTPATTSTSAPKGKHTANEHARYYTAITLNQIFLLPGDTDVALQLMDVYFRMFQDLLNEGKVTEDEEDVHGKLVSAILTGVNRALPFAKIDAAEASFQKHIDTLFLITHTSTFNISLQSLVLIQHLSSSLASQPVSSSRSQSIVNRYYRALYSSLHDGRLASSSKQTMYLNLLFKSLKLDNDIERVKSFVRRFIQVLVTGGAGGIEFVVGGLYLLGEIFSTIPGLRKFLQGMPDPSKGEDYDPRKRDPQFAHPSASPLYELLPLLHHYHPTISLHARQLLVSEPITSSPDLTLNTLSHFLDRFVYKNPKKPKTKGASAMQPAATAADGTSLKRLKGEISGGVLPNEEKFWKRRVEDIPVDEVFFHKYFSRKNRKQLAKSDQDGNGEGSGAEKSLASDKEGADSESNANEEASSDVEEDAVWKAMQATMPREEGDNAFLDEDEDGVLSDLSDPDIADDSSAEENKQETEAEVDSDSDGNEGDDDISLAEGSDDDDLVAMDDLPDGLIECEGLDAAESEDEWGGIGGGDKRKRKEGSQVRRKKRKTLPTFATYEEYAKMIEEGPEDDI